MQWLALGAGSGQAREQLREVVEYIPYSLAASKSSSIITVLVQACVSLEHLYFFLCLLPLFAPAALQQVWMLFFFKGHTIMSDLNKAWACRFFVLFLLEINERDHF